METSDNQMKMAEEMSYSIKIDKKLLEVKAFWLAPGDDIMKRLETFYHVFWTRSTSAPPIYIIVNTTRFEEMREIEPDHDCFDVSINQDKVSIKFGKLSFQRNLARNLPEAETQLKFKSNILVSTLEYLSLSFSLKHGPWMMFGLTDDRTWIFDFVEDTPEFVTTDEFMDKLQYVGDVGQKDSKLKLLRNLMDTLHSPEYEKLKMEFCRYEEQREKICNEETMHQLDGPGRTSPSSYRCSLWHEVSEQVHSSPPNDNSCEDQQRSAENLNCNISPEVPMAMCDSDQALLEDTAANTDSLPQSSTVESTSTSGERPEIIATNIKEEPLEPVEPECASSYELLGQSGLKMESIDDTSIKREAIGEQLPLKAEPGPDFLPERLATFTGFRWSEIQLNTSDPLDSLAVPTTNFRVPVPRNRSNSPTSFFPVSSNENQAVEQQATVETPTAPNRTRKRAPTATNESRGRRMSRAAVSRKRRKPQTCSSPVAVRSSGMKSSSVTPSRRGRGSKVIPPSSRSLRSEIKVKDFIIPLVDIYEEYVLQRKVQKS